MITDARVLKQEFVPNEVQHRNAETNHLSTALEPYLDGDPARDAFLTGPTGAGKTCIAKFTVDRLHEQILDLRHAYVNCWQANNRFRILYRLLQEQGRSAAIPRQGTPTDELLDRLERDTAVPTVVILDEIDQLVDYRVLYDLYNVPNLAMILIANREMEVFSGMDDRIRSRLQSSRRIHFDRYSLDELVSILEARVRWGLADGAVARPQLERIADEAAGDARVAIGILRAAAQNAHQIGVETITDDLVDNVVCNVRDRIRQKNVEKLDEHQSVLYEIIDQHEPIAPGELAERYRERVDDPRTDRTLRNYLTKMERYNLVRAEGKTTNRTYHLVREN